MWVRNETCNDAQDCEWVDLEMCCHWLHSFLTHRNEGIIFFVDVKVLNDAFSQEVLEVFESECQILHVCLLEHRTAALTDDKWSD